MIISSLNSAENVVKQRHSPLSFIHNDFNDSFQMPQQNSSHSEIEQQILDKVDSIISDCEANGKPLEVDPARAQLFETFVLAEAAGSVGETAEPDLSADGLCKSLAERWGLQEAAQQSMVNQTQLQGDQLTKMRSLWSVMRMWMEWTYAWERWAEFHADSAPSVQSEAD